MLGSSSVNDRKSFDFRRNCWLTRNPEAGKILDTELPSAGFHHNSVIQRSSFIETAAPTLLINAKLLLLRPNRFPGSKINLDPRCTIEPTPSSSAILVGVTSEGEDERAAYAGCSTGRDLEEDGRWGTEEEARCEGSGHHADVGSCMCSWYCSWLGAVRISPESFIDHSTVQMIWASLTSPIHSRLFGEVRDNWNAHWP